VKRSVDSRHGETTTAYKWGGDEGLEIPESDLIDEIIQVSKRKSNEELANWSKETTPFEETPFGETMNFSEYDDERLIEDVISEFPELQTILRS
jgi:hypothetical protein